jgi:hypothetical protein
MLVVMHRIQSLPLPAIIKEVAIEVVEVQVDVAAVVEME